MVLRAAGFLVALLTMWQPGVSAQRPVFRSAIELVNLNVTVVGPNLKPVVGLKQDQFAVFEDGVEQTLAFFASGDLPIDALILLDTSASMAESMTLVQQAATQFVHGLRSTDRAAVMGISDGLRVIQPFTGDVAQLDAAIRTTKARGRTLLYSSIYTALKELAAMRRHDEEPRRQAMVVLTDGVDTASLFKFDDLLASVRRESVPVYTIAPRARDLVKKMRESIFGETMRTQDYELRTLARETGGRAFFPAALDELSGVYSEIANELAHQYSLGYQSSNQSRNGEFRRIALRVTAPGVQWRTRTGYLAEPEQSRSGPAEH